VRAVVYGSGRDCANGTADVNIALQVCFLISYSCNHNYMLVTYQHVGSQLAIVTRPVK